MSGLSIGDDAQQMAGRNTQRIQRPYVPLANEASAPPTPPPSRRDSAGWTIGPQNRMTLATFAAVVAIGVPLLYAVWDIRNAVRGSWTIADQREYMRRVEKANPTIILPDIMDVIHARTPQPTPP